MVKLEEVTNKSLQDWTIIKQIIERLADKLKKIENVSNRKKYINSVLKKQSFVSIQTLISLNCQSLISALKFDSKRSVLTKQILTT